MVSAHLKKISQIVHTMAVSLDETLQLIHLLLCIGDEILVKLDHFPKVRDENRKYLKPPPRYVCFMLFHFFKIDSRPLIKGTGKLLPIVASLGGILCQHLSTHPSFNK